MKPSFVIVGLGNPGSSHAETRHNLGFKAVDLLKEKFGAGEWEDRQKFSALVAEGKIGESVVLFVKPQTFMNRSGESIRKIVDFFKLDTGTQLLIISDDIDLPIGEIRMRTSGGPGTHNGLKSVVEQIGENFARLRIGLGAPQKGEDLAAWVLSVPPEGERETLLRVMESVIKPVEDFVG
ncbi:MAG: aminoacyl-tRNA hydrolase [Candidatus Peribacteraceae bacterium]|nr:aminoacyl-tRNA hydrolase [Candidatus Peribacteraceae bacterium]MDD5074638.1 aminoacyl-tRNA hydrolase [Candidatus Peribacteraceae bacterium]